MKVMAAVAASREAASAVRLLRQTTVAVNGAQIVSRSQVGTYGRLPRGSGGGSFLPGAQVKSLRFSAFVEERCAGSRIR